ncbi:hypothetical protein HO542_05050 [Streptococcus suis]|uniref:hypothetical protein n=2 Tax=Clostridium perfringens TaxID=1502 RepID=UPI0005A936B0|nr:hypothetical protein [Clostridium perfringens]NQJ70715.1 hypothetical protein [Streptococcus suis]ELC8422301.1 hypothetical protein [Clostridium perfringens]MCI5749932.1 hypothetical protein [Clostridium perfringens]MDY4421972.1 hypothetical protein [Clostridium perfringens]NGT64751.1 hypothetical protein [Clostridium perfringens]
MTNIGLFINHKNGKVLRAKKSFMPDEMIARRENYYLSDYFIRNDKGGVNIFYQFHTKKYTTLQQPMVFDIECPKCHTTLKINRLGSNGHDHSWYYCQKCNQ